MNVAGAPQNLEFDDPFYPVPSGALDADPVATMRELFYRVARLEQSLQEQRLQSTADLAEVLLSQIALYDDLTHIVESLGVPKNAREALLAKSILALGQKLMVILDHNQVKPIEVLGKPYDPEHSDVVGEMERGDLPEGIVIREQTVGYRWRGGILRRAKVVVSKDKTAVRTVTGEKESGP